MRHISIVLLLVAVAAAGCSNSASSDASRPAVIGCSGIGALRQLRDHLSVATNARTGDSVEYLVIGDAARSNDLLLMFPGTGQTLAGWPVQLITNARYSPNIVHTLGYKAAEDGPVSLCHDYRLLLFDYPGVGKTPYRPNLTRDAIASDVDAVLESLRASGVGTSRVDPLGWSLGTTMAMKYAVLSPVSRPSRSIHDVVLIATGPGGNMQGEEFHGSAACVQTLFNDSQEYGGFFGFKIKAVLSGLIFPFQGQTASENGTKSDCTASISGTSINLSVRLDCSWANNCRPYLYDVILGNRTYPWILSNGIGPKIYDQERAIARDWYLNYCARAGPNFSSLGCQSFGPVTIAKTNGGVCRTDVRDVDRPVARACDRIRLSGKITVIASYEDLLDQWTYGAAVVDGFRRSQGRHAANLVLYPGSAGHGLLIQHPGWTQAQIDAAISR